MTTDLQLFTKPAADTDFLQVFNRLCVALREPQDDSGVTQGIYFEALKDLPIAALEGGANALMKEPGRRFFPTTAEWRTAAEKAQTQQFKQAVQPEPGREWVTECVHCDDTGWERFECTGDRFCGRERKHAPHSFVRICSCRPTNRTYQRHQHFGGGAA